MSFNSYPFLLGFLPLALTGFALAGRHSRTAAKAWLIAMSLLFYAIGAPDCLPLLIASVTANYLLIRHITQTPVIQTHVIQSPGIQTPATKAPNHQSPDHRKPTLLTPTHLVTIGVIANLALLACFKYPGQSVPLGLSFFTFTQIGALLHFAAEPGTRPPTPTDYALFAANFPALLAGPILNPGETIGQFARIHRLTRTNLATGSTFFIIGLLKKTLLADPLSAIVTPGFADPTHLTLLPAWQTAAAYSLQLYFDFSGYTDMAIGLARIIGVRFPDNFDRPYAAATISQYWQRWHMSLTRFLMANIHTPLTLAILRHRRSHHHPIDQAAQRSPRGFTLMIAAPIAATMLPIALWHGATLPFLVFGLFHTAYLLAHHAWRTARMPQLPTPAAIALTYLATLVAAVIFRAPDLGTAHTILSAMAGRAGTAITDPHPLKDPIWLVCLYAIVYLAPTTRQFVQNGPWRPTQPWALALGSAATLGLLAAGGTTQFVYFRF